jgi:hypothetical protein
MSIPTGEVLRILALIALGLAWFLAGPALGERLQTYRRPGVPHLPYPRRDAVRWIVYVSSDRYTPGGVRLLYLLVVSHIMVPLVIVGLLVAWYS